MVAAIIVLIVVGLLIGLVCCTASNEKEKW